MALLRTAILVFVVFLFAVNLSAVLFLFNFKATVFDANFYKNAFEKHGIYDAVYSTAVSTISNETGLPTTEQVAEQAVPKQEFKKALDTVVEKFIFYFSTPDAKPETLAFSVDFAGKSIEVVATKYVSEASLLQIKAMLNAFFFALNVAIALLFVWIAIIIAAASGLKNKVRWLGIAFTAGSFFSLASIAFVSAIWPTLFPEISLYAQYTRAMAAELVNTVAASATTQAIAILVLGIALIAISFFVKKGNKP